MPPEPILDDSLLLAPKSRPPRPRLRDLAATIAFARRGSSVEGLTAKITFEWLIAYGRWILLAAPLAIFFMSDGLLLRESIALFGAILLLNAGVIAALWLAPWTAARFDLVIRLMDLILTCGAVTLVGLMAGSMEFNALYGVFIVIGAIGSGLRRTIQLSVATLTLMTAGNTIISQVVPGVTTLHALGNVLFHAVVFAATAAVALFLLGRERQMAHYAHTDGLTGFHNKRAFYPTLRHVTETASLTREPVSLILCDLDHFKEVNDTYGHAVGDEVLKMAAGRILRKIRQFDVACRIGGEEFAVILPDTPVDAAFEVAERIRRAVSDGPGPHGRPVTVSVGVSSWLGPRDSIDDLFRRADEALYESKTSGRNRTTVNTGDRSGAPAKARPS